MIGLANSPDEPLHIHRGSRVASAPPAAISLGGGVLLSGCGGSPSILSPAGAPARELATLGWWLIGAGGLVVIAIVVLVLVPLLRRHGGFLPQADLVTTGGGTGRIVAGAALTVLVLGAFFVYTVIVLRRTASPPAAPDLAIQVIGHEWWWEVRYRRPGEAPETVTGNEIRLPVTANEIHLPVAQPVRLEVSSADVVHSFWVPQLQGKIDLVPGQTNVFWLQADRPGTYAGQCAEYCGTEHARMRLRVTAEPRENFERWLAKQREPAAQPVGDVVAGRRAFDGAACAFCHSVRGTPAAGRVGPDLTHLASRATLAAGTLANTPGNLAAWVADAPAIKPGTPMPRMELDPETLRSIVAYLRTLE
jgi:cytochrome c oxidase subunit 2